MTIDYMTLVVIALIPFTIYSIKKKPKWVKEIDEEREWGKQVWELFKQKLEAEG